MSFFSVFLITTPVLFLFTMVFIFPKKLVSSIEFIVSEFSLWTKQNVADVMQLIGLVDENILITHDDALLSAIEIHGSLGVVGHEEFMKIQFQLNSLFNANLTKKDTHIQYVFENTEDIEGRLHKFKNAQVATAKRIGLDIDDLILEDSAALSKVFHDEKTLLIIKTFPEGKPSDIDRHYNEERERMGFKDVKLKSTLALPITHRGQEDRHRATKMAVCDAMKAARMLFSEVSANELLKIQAECLDPDFTGDFEARIPPKHKPSKNFDGEFQPYQPLWRQVVSSDILETEPDGKPLPAGVVRIVSRYYASGWVEIPPFEFKSFASLRESMKGNNYRLSFRIHPDGLLMNRFNRNIVDFFSIFKNSVNRQIKEGFDSIAEQSKQGDHDVGVSITFTTWASSLRDVLAQQAAIKSKLQGWGVCTVRTDCGSSSDLFLSSIPAFTANSPAKVMPLNVSDACTLLPVFSPACAWNANEGGVIFGDIHGKIQPFVPGSSKQKAWSYLIFAPTGSGKSVTLNSIQLACCLRAGLTKLPLMVVIDIGESVKGFIELIVDALPQQRSHEATYVKMQMRPEYAFNPMDTQLGYRYPLLNERELIINLLSLIATPAGKKIPNENIFELSGMVVDEAYKFFSDAQHPKKYQPNVNLVVDAAIEKFNIKTDESTTYWELVDEFFTHGLVHEATIAQRYAVPMLEDLTSVLNTKQIRDMFGKKEGVGDQYSNGVVVGNENILEYMARMISTMLRDYPVLSRPTAFDLGSARVVGIDLGSVRGSNSDAGFKQTALMYLFAQSLSTRNYYLHEEMLAFIPLHCPEMYREHYASRIKEVQEELKISAFDEFHNTGGLEAARRGVSLNIREGRKFSIMTILASQLLDDFDKDMIDNSSGYFFMSAESNVMVKEAQEKFGLSDSETMELKNEVTSIGRFMGIFTTSEGRTVHVLKNVLSAIKYWAFTTTAEDKAIRAYLSKRVGSKEARRLLSQSYPSGIKAAVEKLKFNTDSDNIDSAIDRIANALLENSRLN